MHTVKNRTSLLKIFTTTIIKSYFLKITIDPKYANQGGGRSSFKDPGVFIAVGAGITPMLSILREQKQERSGMSAAGTAENAAELATDLTGSL